MLSPTHSTQDKPGISATAAYIDALAVYGRHPALMYHQEVAPCHQVPVEADAQILDDDPSTELRVLVQELTKSVAALARTLQSLQESPKEKIQLASSPEDVPWRQQKRIPPTRGKDNDRYHQDGRPICRCCNQAGHIASGYWQVPMAEADKEKTAFTTPMAHPEMNNMPFRLWDAPGTLQRMMECCLGQKNSETILLYLDDVIVFSKMYEDHLKHQAEVFEALSNFGLKVKPSKCHLLKPELQYLGHVVSTEGVAPDPDKVTVIRDWMKPSNIHEVRQLLRLVGYCRRLIKDFTKIAAPLQDLLVGQSKKTKNKNTQFEWNDRMKGSFTRLKWLSRRMRAALSNPMFTLVTILKVKKTNASYLPSAVCPPALCFPALTVTTAAGKQSGDVTLSGRCAHSQYREAERRGQTAEGALEQQWMARLFNYEFTIKYRAGHKNANADALSRMPNLPEVEEDPEALEEIELPAFHHPGVTQYSHHVKCNDKQEATLNPLPHHGWTVTPQSICPVLEIRNSKKIRTTPYHPQTNGMCEKMNQVHYYDLLDENSRPLGPGPFTDLKPSSTRMPPSSTNTSIDIFTQLVISDLRKLSDGKRGKQSNLSRGERRALDNLSANTELVIKPSDKRGNLVIMDHKKYKEMCLKILTDTTTYGPIRGDITESLSAELNILLSEAYSLGLISKRERDFMVQKTPTTPVFYALPKVHEGFSPLKGRPIVSGNDSVSQNCGIYVDKILRQSITALPSYIHDTSDLLLKIEDITVDKGTYLASIDVDVLYSSIPHNMGLKAVEFYLKTSGTQFVENNQFLI
ncbi:unnamed protein product [Ranitomeya imitator]|uniref:ribonuclease H n=1 Tax=Ranitomeya imitator TaxID=111125 RepID=A0ABN9L6K2_9NEOB|nr:unnamed protein product [Ranitomeya imitator]